MSSPQTYVHPLEPRRYCDGGNVDLTFGAQGTASINFSSALGIAADWHVVDETITPTADCGIFVTASANRVSSFIRDYPILIARLTNDGKLNTNFGVKGIVRLDRSRDPTATMTQPAIDAGGRIYLLDGEVLSRLTASGKLDKSFGTGGKIIVPILDRANGVSIDGDGRAYLYGRARASVGFCMAVVGLTENGSVDSTFGTGGAFKSPVPAAKQLSFNEDRTADAILARFMPDGRLLLAGPATCTGVLPHDLNGTRVTHRMAWGIRLMPDGTRDTVYGRDGISQVSDLDLGQLSDHVSTLAPGEISKDGAILCAASGRDSTNGDFLFHRRIIADGSRDVSVSLVPEFLRSDADVDFARNPVTQSDGKVLVQLSNELIRVRTDGRIDRSWAGDGRLAAYGRATIDPEGTIYSVSSAFRGTQPTVLSISRFWRDDGIVATASARTLRDSTTSTLRITVTYRDDDGVQAQSIVAMTFG